MKQVVIKSMFGLLKLVFDDQELVKVSQASYNGPSDTIDQNRGSRGGLVSGIK